MPFLTSALALAALASCRPADRPAPAPLANEPAAAAAPAGPLDLIQRGDFAGALAAKPADADLAADLARFQAGAARRAAERAASLAKKEEEMQQAVAAGNLEDALAALIQAKEQTADAEAYIRQPKPAELIAKATKTARDAEAKSDWVAAGTLYRLLDLVQERTRPHHHDIERTARHEAALGLYNPAMLVKLYEAQLARRRKTAEKDDEAPALETTPWQERLRGVTQAMLTETFLRSSRDHVLRPKFAQLLGGALTGLDTTLATAGVDEAFPNLKDAKRLGDFRAELQAIQAEVKAKPEAVGYRECLAAFERLRQANAGSLQLPVEMLWYELAQGATSTLDPFSTVIWPEQLPEFLRSMQGDFFGIGVLLSNETRELKVSTPMAGTPAMDAGIRPGDVITHVNGQSTEGWNVDKAIKHITGPEGTTVTLTVKHEGDPVPVTMTLKRARIEIHPIKGWARVGAAADNKWSYWIDKDAGIGYLRMSQFLPKSVEEMDHAIGQLKSEGAIRGLIVDLRFNPGGLLTAAAGAADRFLDKGRIVATINAQKEEVDRIDARKGKYGDFPVAVLVNDNSASASEILSGCLQEHQRALVVGENSYGKGSVQHVNQIAGGQALYKLTTERYTLPSGRCLHRDDDSTTWGVVPDLAVPMTREEMRKWIDARQEADLGQDMSPKNDRGPYSADQILAEGLDPQAEAALLWLEAKAGPAPVAAK